MARIVALVAWLALAWPTVSSAADGAALYQDRCAACHQVDGAGLPGMAPPLRSAVWGKLGRRAPDYLAAVALNGMSGNLLDGQSYAGAMPSWSALSDAELAAVGSYVLQGLNGGKQQLTAGEAAAMRRRGHLDAPHLKAMRAGGAP